jgi:hypothetical protein
VGQSAYQFSGTESIITFEYMTQILRVRSGCNELINSVLDAEGLVELPFYRCQSSIGAFLSTVTFHVDAYSEIGHSDRWSGMCVCRAFAASGRLDALHT